LGYPGGNVFQNLRHERNKKLVVSNTYRNPRIIPSNFLIYKANPKLDHGFSGELMGGTILSGLVNG
jgi:hypothetical protein